jgi:hypothetical protein
VTTHPDALEAIRHAVQVLVCGGFQCRPVVLGDGLKQNAWGGSGKPKIVVNGACLASAVDHQTRSKNRNFMKLTTNTSILDDFRHKSHQKQSVDHLKVVFLTPK